MHSPGSTKLGCDWDLELENPILGLETPIFELEVLILVDFGLETYLKPGVLVVTTCRLAEKGVRLI